MIPVNIKNETSKLITVVLGIAENFGGIPLVEDCYDPKSIEHVQAGTFPNSKSCVDQINEFFEVLEKYNVNILRPKNIYGINQIFTRDIAFVIENKLILPNIIKDRVEELTAISFILDQVNTCNILKTPSNVRVEGGDVIVCNDHIFVGYSEKEDFDKYIVSRTNRLAINFLSQNFPFTPNLSCFLYDSITQCLIRLRSNRAKSRGLECKNPPLECLRFLSCFNR